MLRMTEEPELYIVTPPAPSLWATAAAMAEEEPEEPEAVVQEIFIRGAITELSAKIKAGKTTFIGAMLRAIFAGEEFIGLETEPTPILYLTEEGQGTFSAMLRKVGLDEEENLYVLRKNIVPVRMAWPDVIVELVWPKLQETGAKGIIIDTLSRWAGVKGEEENQAGAAATAMEPLEILRNEGIAIMTVMHSGRGGHGGDVSNAHRGSSAWGGAGDVLLALENPNTHGHPNRRKLESLGRFHDPNTWLMDLEHGSYILRSTNEYATIERDSAKGAIMANLTGPKTFKEIRAFAPTVPDTTLKRALSELVSGGLVTFNKGNGSRHNPSTWQI